MRTCGGGLGYKKPHLYFDPAFVPRVRLRARGAQRRNTRLRNRMIMDAILIGTVTAYFVLLAYDVSAHWTAPVKIIPLYILLLRIMSTRNDYALSVVFGLAFCMLGDVLLEFQAFFSEQPMFLGGLAAFLVGHCFYIRAFTFNHLPISLGNCLITASTIGYIQWFGSILYPRLPPDLELPVRAYVTIIGLMIVLACCRHEHHAGFQASRAMSAVGASFFAASDSLLAYNKFVAPVPHAKYLVMATYYAGQYGLALSSRGAVQGAEPQVCRTVEDQIVDALRSLLRALEKPPKTDARSRGVLKKDRTN